LTFQVQDNGGTANAGVDLDQSPNTLTINVTSVNDAPVLDATKTPVLNSENQNAGAPSGAVGTLVSSLVDLNPPAGGLDNVSDVDAGAVTGIALTATDSAHGTWFYSTNNGNTWTAVGSVLNTSALLLAADGSTRLYFQPAVGFNGTDTGAITFRAWDQTSGSNGTKVDTSTNGGTTAFSTTTDTANITINATDTTPPTVTISSDNNGSKPTITFTFSEAVVGFDLTDIKIVGATAGPIQHVGLNGSGQDVYTLALSNATGSGTHTIQVIASGTGTSSWTDLAGNPGVGSAVFGLPAGVSGAPINLGLTDPAPDRSGLVSVLVAGVPSGWILNGGTSNADGTWTVQTNDVASLSVTSPADYNGALVLNVTETWTNADGTTGIFLVSDNVEAYAPGSPIFAVSGDDTLTGSSGSDAFVFAQPIGNDTVYNFDAASDSVDLIGFGITGFAALQADLSTDASGNALITLGANETITLKGVDAGALTAQNFVFDEEPVTANAGTMSIGDGAILPFGGTIDNTGTIALGSTGDETDLEILVRGGTLQGGGQVILSDSSQNVIFGGTGAAVLTNVDNTISGAGQLGEGQLTLVNQGTIVATGSNALVIDTAGNAVTNSGMLEATGAGGLDIKSALVNTGTIEANGGNITAEGAVTGGGNAIIAGGATLEFGAASDANVSFADGTTGSLLLEQSLGFSGTVAGFGAGDTLDLGDIAFGANTTLAFSENAAGTGGTLAVSDGAETASIALLGQYAASAFVESAGEGGGTAITYTAQTPGSTLATPQV
jgi:hypothetical protein